MENDIFGGFAALAGNLVGAQQKVDVIIPPSQITGNATNATEYPSTDCTSASAN